MMTENVNTPEISIIIPGYNVQEYMDGCLESVITQTFGDFECICVDDGSTDDTGAIMDFFAQRDTRLRVIHQENGGLSNARNVGLDNARGKYIYFLDSDDYLHPQALEILHSFITMHDVDIVSCVYIKTAQKYLNNFKWIDVTGIKTQLVDKPLDAFIKRKIVKTGVQFKIYKRDVIGNLRFIEGIKFEDVPFTTVLFSKAKSLLITNAPIYYYATNPNSIMRSGFTIDKVQSYVTIFQKVYDFIAQNEPQYLDIVKRDIINTRLKMMFNQAIRKQKDKRIRSDLFAMMALAVPPLVRSGVVTYTGLSLHHKLVLWLLCNCKTSKYARIAMQLTSWM